MSFSCALKEGHRAGLNHLLRLTAVFALVLIPTRLLLAVQGAYLILSGGTAPLIAGLFVLLVVMDIADGLLYRLSPIPPSPIARAYRRIADALVDRAIVQIAAGAALAAGWIDSSVFAIIWIREAILIAVTVSAYLNRSVILSPNLPSRLASIHIPALLIAPFLFPGLLIPCLASFIAFGCVGILRYFHASRFFKCATG